MVEAGIKLRTRSSTERSSRKLPRILPLPACFWRITFWHSHPGRIAVHRAGSDNTRRVCSHWGFTEQPQAALLPAHPAVGTSTLWRPWKWIGGQLFQGWQQSPITSEAADLQGGQNTPETLDMERMATLTLSGFLIELYLASWSEEGNNHLASVPTWEDWTFLILLCVLAHRPTRLLYTSCRTVLSSQPRETRRDQNWQPHHQAVKVSQRPGTDDQLCGIHWSEDLNGHCRTLKKKTFA